MRESLTPQEYADEVEAAIENLDLPRYKIIDLRALAKFARLRGRVNRIDEVLLKWAEIPQGRPVLQVPKKAKQVSLF